jgi:hypothetical protein
MDFVVEVIGCGATEIAGLDRSRPLNPFVVKRPFQSALD